MELKPIHRRKPSERQVLIMPVIVARCRYAATAERGFALWPEMIDLHCHILPGVDDGALDIRDSAGLARQAAADGIEAICATPHIRHDHDVRIDEVASRVESLGRHLRDEGIPVVVLPGGEVAETAVEGLSEAELARVAPHGGRPAKMAAAFERLAEVEPAATHLEWMRETAPRAIVEGGRLNVPFDPA